jgi:hypothetical protein
MHLRSGWVCLAALGLAGCGFFGGRPQVAGPAPDDSRLPDHTDIALAETLGKPREELAQLVKETREVVKKRESEDRTEREAAMLPRLQPPATLPILHNAVYSEKAGLSLPSYLKDNVKDSEVALHVARHGDVEAALKMVDLKDKEAVRQVEACRGDRNYPLEWVQWAALKFEDAEFRLAHDDAQAAADLVQMHKQLKALLPEKAASGPLGAVLLPLGRRALAEAAQAWKDKRPQLAADVTAALKGWGDAPAVSAGLKPGDSQARAERLLRSSADGFAVATRSPESARRAVDLLALPLVPEGVQAVVAFLDDRKAVREVAVVYHGKIDDRYPEPANLAHFLINRDCSAAAESAKDRRLARQTWTGDGLSFEVLVAPQAALGGLVRVADAKQSPTRGVLGADARDLGAVHLDGSYEQNRVNLGAEFHPTELKVNRADLIARVRQPAREQPTHLRLKRHGKLDLAESVTQIWPTDLNVAAISALAVPFWSAYGDAKVEEDDDASFLNLVWENAQTRYALRLPYDVAQPPEFVASDRESEAQAKEKAEAARAFDQAQRKGRLAAKKSLDFLPRSLPCEPLGPQAEQIYLGQGRDKVLGMIPARSSAAQRFDLEDGSGLLLVFTVHATEGSTFFPQQLSVRFDHSRVSEVRVRYQETPHDNLPTLQSKLRERAGSPEKLPAPWARLWSETPSSAVLLRWRDDRSLMTYQADAGGAEVTLRDWPIDEPLDAEPTPLLFCSRGPSGCKLGEGRAEVLGRKWLKEPKKTDDGGVILYSSDPKSTHDTLLVYFEGDKVARVNARHRTKPAENDAFAALRGVWGRDLAHLGSLRRVEPAAGLQFKGGYGWHDDRTRVRSFVQVGESADLWSEWRTWPLPARTEVARP